MPVSHKKTVAIVVPMYKEKLSENEKISIKHLLHFLGNYDKYFITPKKLRTNHPEFKIIKFNNKYFKNTKTYSKLLLTKNFYKKFNDYKYILIYQLDALVFSDQLLYWCNKNYDYIGAPWINSEMKKLNHNYNKPDHCGNGGFSLRNIKNSIKTLENYKKILPTILRGLITTFSLIKKLINDEINLLRNKKKDKKILMANKKILDKINYI